MSPSFLGHCLTERGHGTVPKTDGRRKATTNNLQLKLSLDIRATLDFVEFRPSAAEMKSHLVMMQMLQTDHSTMRGEKMAPDVGTRSLR